MIRFSRLLALSLIFAAVTAHAYESEKDGVSLVLEQFHPEMEQNSQLLTKYQLEYHNITQLELVLKNKSKRPVEVVVQPSFKHLNLEELYEVMKWTTKKQNAEYFLGFVGGDANAQRIGNEFTHSVLGNSGINQIYLASNSKVKIARLVSGLSSLLSVPAGLLLTLLSFGGMAMALEDNKPAVAALGGASTIASFASIFAIPYAVMFSLIRHYDKKRIKQLEKHMAKQKVMLMPGEAIAQYYYLNEDEYRLHGRVGKPVKIMCNKLA